MATTNAASITAQGAALSNPWRDDDGRPLATLLALEEGPGPAPAAASGSWAGLTSITRMFGWRRGVSYVNRCGIGAGRHQHTKFGSDPSRGGATLSAADRRRIDPFLTSVFGTPEAPAPADHLEGHVAEVLWYLLTLEIAYDERNLRNAEGPSFSVTETGGDGLAIWQTEDGGLVCRLWEIKKDSGTGHISRTDRKSVV